MSVPKKSLYDDSTDPFPFPSSDHTHDDKVSCMPDSLIQFSTLLSIREAQKVRVRPWVPDFIFSAGCMFGNFWAQNGCCQFPSLLCFYNSAFLCNLRYRKATLRFTACLYSSWFWNGYAKLPTQLICVSR